MSKHPEIVKASRTLYEFTFKMIIFSIIVVLAIFYHIHEYMVFTNWLFMKNESPRENGRRGIVSPKEYDIRHYDDLMLKTTDGKDYIHTWVIKHERSLSKKTLIIFHGRGGNIGLRLPFIIDAHHTFDVNIVIIDYKGFGQSTGYPSEHNVKISVDTVCNYVYNHPNTFDLSNVYAYGISLGSTPALYATSKYEWIKRTLLENPILDIPSSVSTNLRWASFITGWYNKFDNKKIIEHVRQPITFFTSKYDKVIPFQSSFTLMSMSKNPDSQLFFFENDDAGHSNLWISSAREDYLRLFKAFLYD